MHKNGFPTSESWFDIVENPTISLLPNAPTCQDDHFSETWSREVLFSIGHDFRNISRFPWNLKEVPNS